MGTDIVVCIVRSECDSRISFDAGFSKGYLSSGDRVVVSGPLLVRKDPLHQLIGVFGIIAHIECGGVYDQHRGRVKVEKDWQRRDPILDRLGF